MTIVQNLYHRYIHPLSRKQKLEMLELLKRQMQPKDKEQLAKKYSVMNFAGAGKKYRMKEDAQVYISKLRDEWD